MTGLAAGSRFPTQKVAQLGGGTLTLGVPQGGQDWQLVVVYRGLHCPICKTYLAKLDGLVSDFNDLGVDVVVVSGDPEPKAQTMVDEKELTLNMGYGLDIAQMQALGLYISDPRSAQETDRPFPEPGLFVINDKGDIQIIDISNAPFARPELESIKNGIKFIRANGYPIRGTHVTA
ncbi:redoxin domain-containing protein [Sulfitobacter sp. M57]|uniref:redoxin domain-containing protein n=1 Tax=unclassified Sulfitobacter TaxID=196795 RepID=UPI0023E1D047|nr:MULTISPECIES: redoxin domain-containing protein [unclassified Sulfitobacter]MDF3414127.1 redoxin domain-containing protein [Sulfitobacter sp. KE5]MDF3420592.1 redoxin domain-containing protein [Sulfitobacter sp. KE43]MDF3432673.1 redoxin domain-containing protein [Sulfitobacter sp. KE42]MDF3458312.1 redoxin domain-containing protein [Sulfitobacter sp. S74]MDF3462213.1 redoxin domain-containing protein [Sulfitobacter sp. Ks18]